MPEGEIDGVFDGTIEGSMDTLGGVDGIEEGWLEGSRLGRTETLGFVDG